MKALEYKIIQQPQILLNIRNSNKEEIMLNKKKIKNLFCIIFLLINTLTLYNMEKQITSNEKIIEDYHGNIFSVPTTTLEKCNIFQYASDFVDNNFDFEKKDIWDQLFSRRFPKRDFSFFQTEATDTPLSKEVLKIAFKCIKQPKKCESLPKEQIRSVFAAVNFLNPKKEKVAKKLARQMKAIIPHKELKEDNEIDYIVLTGMYEKSIDSLKKEELPPYSSENFNFSNKKLDTIKGLEKLGTRKISTLNLNNNKLTELDIDAIIKQFPDIEIIDASFNDISTLILSKQLKNYITIRLNHNNIKELPDFSMGKNGRINLHNNPLSKDAHETIKRALKPPFLKRNRHYLYLLKDISTTFFWGSIIGGFLTISIAAPITYLWYGIEFESASNNETVKYPMRALCLSMAAGYYYISKIERLFHKIPLDDTDLCLNKCALIGASISGIGFLISEYCNHQLTDYKHQMYIQEAQILTDSDSKEH